MSKYLIPEINLDDYEYFLPKEKIALFPLEKREDSKLLFANTENDDIKDFTFADISDLIESNSLIILNETKVIGARLHFNKPTGGKVELLMVEPVEPSVIPAITLAKKGNCSWECIVGGRNINAGMLLTFPSDAIDIKAEIISRYRNKAVVKFYWNHDITFSELLDKYGETPLPPYIDREESVDDHNRYQTVYAREQGSVAAPTAGLHFTDSVLQKLELNNVEFSKITLHIGPGTFQPIETDDLVGHIMHHEQIFVSKKTIESIRDAIECKKRIVAVGTTCIRTIESLYWLGLNLTENDIDLLNVNINQWEPYRTIKQMNALESLNVILSEMENNGIEKITGKTSLIIIPGYDFKIFNGMITNFHMPKSTLILLVAAFAGKELWRKIYEFALKNDFRFLSFGDSSYLIKSIT